MPDNWINHRLLTDETEIVIDGVKEHDLLDGNGDILDGEVYPVLKSKLTPTQEELTLHTYIPDTIIINNASRWVDHVGGSVVGMSVRSRFSTYNTTTQVGAERGAFPNGSLDNYDVCHSTSGEFMYFCGKGTVPSKTVDFGNTITNMVTPITPVHVLCNPAGDTVTIFCIDGYKYTSEDYGVTWVKGNYCEFYDGIDTTYIDSSMGNSVSLDENLEDIFVVAGSAVFRSQDYGITFNQVIIAENVNINNIAYKESTGTIFLGASESATTNGSLLYADVQELVFKKYPSENWGNRGLVAIDDDTNDIYLSTFTRQIRVFKYLREGYYLPLIQKPEGSPVGYKIIADAT